MGRAQLQKRRELNSRMLGAHSKIAQKMRFCGCAKEGERPKGYRKATPMGGAHEGLGASRIDRENPNFKKT